VMQIVTLEYTDTFHLAPSTASETRHSLALSQCKEWLLDFTLFRSRSVWTYHCIEAEHISYSVTKMCSLVYHASVSSLLRKYTFTFLSKLQASPEWKTGDIQEFSYEKDHKCRLESDVLVLSLRIESLIGQIKKL